MICYRSATSRTSACVIMWVSYRLNQCNLPWQARAYQQM